jgi:L-ascorbate metabolism protein UlaG (beta-lactamase superfamily)
MGIYKKVSVVVLTVMLFGTYQSSFGKAKDVNAPSSDAPVVKTVPQLLADIVHLRDNDIRFRTTDGICIFIDPVTGPTDEKVVKTGMVKPDLILITHSHGDHFQPAVLQEYLKLNPRALLAGPTDVVKLAGEKGIKGMNTVIPGKDYTLVGIHFSTVPAHFTEGNSHPRANQWVGYVLQLNKISYYITGDTQPLPEMAKIKPDVLFPLLYGCGGNIEQAVRMAKLTRACVVVPVHTSGQEEVIKKFIAQLPKAVQGAYYKEGKLIVNP